MFHVVQSYVVRLTKTVASTLCGVFKTGEGRASLGRCHVCFMGAGATQKQSGVVGQMAKVAVDQAAQTKNLEQGQQWICKRAPTFFPPLTVPPATGRALDSVLLPPKSKNIAVSELRRPALRGPCAVRWALRLGLCTLRPKPVVRIETGMHA